MDKNGMNNTVNHLQRFAALLQKRLKPGLKVAECYFGNELVSQIVLCFDKLVSQADWFIQGSEKRVTNM